MSLLWENLALVGIKPSFIYAANLATERISMVNEKGGGGNRRLTIFSVLYNFIGLTREQLVIQTIWIDTNKHKRIIKVRKGYK
jgi:hypothetical protein